MADIGPSALEALERLEDIASYQPRPNMKRELRELADVLRTTLAKATPSPAVGDVRRTGAVMIARHRFCLHDDGNCAEIDSAGLAEEIDASLAKARGEDVRGSSWADFARQQAERRIEAEAALAKAVADEREAAAAIQWLREQPGCSYVATLRDVDEALRLIRARTLATPETETSHDG